MKLIVLAMFCVSFLLAAVDINSAGAKELTTLKGIGASKAEAIIAFRTTHCFKSVDELAQVKGIGEKTVQINRKNLVAGACIK